MLDIGQRDRCLEGSGPEALPHIVEALLDDFETHRYDVGVVRNLLDDDGIQTLQDAYSIISVDSGRDSFTSTPERMELALDEATDDVLPEVSNIVSDFWAAKGISKELRLEVSPRLHFDRCIIKSSRSHIDSIPPEFDNKALSSLPLNGPITLSVRMDSAAKSRLFYARRLPVQHTPTLDREIHDIASYQRLSARVARWHVLRDVMCTVVEQRAGDAIVLPAHPWPSIHSTKYGEMSWVALYDFRLARPN